MAKQNTIVLDFSLLPSVESRGLFASLSQELELKLEAYPETLQRAKAAVHFCAHAPHPPRTGEEDLRLREAYLRAALGEFVSMEETLKLERTDGRATKIVVSKNPLLHIVKQLRNLQFHLQTSILTADQQRVLMMGDEHDIDIWHIGDLSVAEFDQLNDAHRYSTDDKTAMIDWFNQSQRVFGTSDLVWRAVTEYINEIAE